MDLTVTENNNESTEGVMGFVYGASGTNEINFGFAVIELHEAPAHLVPDVLEAAGESGGRDSGYEDLSVIGIMCKINFYRG